MSANKLKSIRLKIEENKKDLTPKGSKYSPKISPVYSSFRNGVTLKADSNSKVKLSRPLTSKNQHESPHYFHSRESERKTYQNSNKRIDVIRKPYEYQPRSKSKSPIKQPQEIIREEVYIHPKQFELKERGIRSFENDHPPLPKLLTPISNFEPAKHSLKPNGLIRAYAASTNQGPVRDYNEDRVAIILNIGRPEHCAEWKKAAYFGVFDGHGGMDCADFLRDNLHNFVARQKTFPEKMAEALVAGFLKCEEVYVEQSANGKVDRSGSCAIITFFYGAECYICNVGDSRAMMSADGGRVVRQLSYDHKASDEFEQKRIIEIGGRIYQTKLRNSDPSSKIHYEGEEHPFIMGPHRVLPGRLSVTRTFGDIEAKIPSYGGNPKAIICTPEITCLTVSANDDFLVLASDGIFDKMSNADIVEVVWSTFARDKARFRTLHEFCGRATENIMKLAFHKKTLDNITVVLVALEGLERAFAKLDGQPQPQNRKVKGISKLESSLERKGVGHSKSPSTYTSVRTKSFHRN